MTERTDYKLSEGELLTLAHGRLADIDTMISEGDTTADWHAERVAQLRLIDRIAA